MLFQRLYSQETVQKRSRLPSTTGGGMCPLSSGAGILFPLISHPRVERQPIPDLQRLNTFICHFKFRIVTLASLIPSSDSQNCFTDVCLQDAYIHISIHLAHREYLRFLVGSSHYQYKFLPLNLCTGHRIFTKCLAIMAAQPKKQRIQVYPYLNDWLIRGRSPQQVTDSV